MPKFRRCQIAQHSRGWAPAAHEAVPASGGPFSPARKGNKGQRLRPWRMSHQKPFLLYAPKETVFEIQRKALSGPSVRSSMDRRYGNWDTHYPLRRFR